MDLKMIAVGTTLGAYLIGLGFLGGMAVERIRFDADRQVVVKRLNDEAAHVKAKRIALEHRIDGDRPAIRAR